MEDSIVVTYSLGISAAFSIRVNRNKTYMEAFAALRRNFPPHDYSMSLPNGLAISPNIRIQDLGEEEIILVRIPR